MAYIFHYFGHTCHFRDCLVLCHLTLRKVYKLETQLEREKVETERATTMASRVSIALFFLFAIPAMASYVISASESESKEFVLTLDHSNFNETVSRNKFIVVEFYAPW